MKPAHRLGRIGNLQCWLDRHRDASTIIAGAMTRPIGCLATEVEANVRHAARFYTRWILSDGARNVVAVSLAYEAEGEACLTAPLGLRAIGVHWGLFRVWIRRLNALEPRLPLCGR